MHEPRRQRENRTNTDRNPRFVSMTCWQSRADRKAAGKSPIPFLSNPCPQEKTEAVDSHIRLACVRHSAGKGQKASRSGQSESGKSFEKSSLATRSGLDHSGRT